MTRAIAVPTHAARTDSTPVTSSRFAVRGFSASKRRSRMRLADIATVRADTIAIVMSSSCTQCTLRVSRHMAVSAAM
jgi:hypothetical protein